MQPFPRWVTWIFVALLAYIIYMGNKAQHPPESIPQEPVEATNEAPREYDSLRRLTDGDRWFRAINPNYIGDAYIKEIKTGEGDAVACGDEVEILLRGTDTTGASFDTSHDESKPLKFHLGDAPIAALNEGIIGMKQNGTRQLVAPAKLVYDAPGDHSSEDVTFHLSLKSHTTKDADMPAFAVTTRSGTDKDEPARCGETIRAKFSVFDASGKRIYASESPVSFTLGKRELASGIDTLARGLEIDEERLLTIPPVYLTQGKGANAALRTALSSKELRVVQITRVE